MHRRAVLATGLVLAALTIAGCAHMGDGGWVTLIDGEKGLENFNRIGDANWRAEGGAIVADKGKGGHLVTKQSYRNFQIRAEFWADHHTNSGVHFRAADRNKVGSTSAYEVNIYDQSGRPEYSTGSLVNFYRIPLPVTAAYKAGGKWNTLLITARDTHIVAEFNGLQTVNLYDSQYAEGPITLQFSNHGKQPGGAIKFRLLQVRPL